MVVRASSFQWMSMLHKTYNVTHIWNYFETRHGKGEHNRVGACINTTLRREEMRFTKNPHIKDAESIVQWCSATMSNWTKVQHTSTRVGRPIKNFWHVVDIDRSYSYSCSVVQGTHGFNSFQSLSNPLFEIWTWKLACFCSPCRSGEWDECECIDWVDDWDRVSLAIDPCVVIETTHLEEV